MQLPTITEDTGKGVDKILAAAQKYWQSFFLLLSVLLNAYQFKNSQEIQLKLLEFQQNIIENQQDLNMIRHKVTSIQDTLNTKNPINE